MQDQVGQHLSRFSMDETLRDHLGVVLRAMPLTVLSDLLEDPAFTVCDFDPAAGRVFQVSLGLPSRGKPSRSVVLKRTVLRRGESFVRWVIAHELAHAHLRNGGRFPGDDPEHAADALAEQWGFPRPRTW